MSIRTSRRLPSGLLLVLLVLLVLLTAPAQAIGAVAPSATPATAAPSPTASAAAPAPRMSWSVQPSSATGPSSRPYFTYDLAPGARMTDYVGVTNIGTTPLTLAVYAADARNNPAGSFDLQAAATKATDVGAWVTLERTQITIPPRTRADIPFVLRVPSNASPGDHVGGIVAGVTTATSDSRGNSVSQERRVGARIYLRVNGPARPEVSVTNVAASFTASGNPFAGGNLDVTYTLRNTGNMRLTGQPSITVDGPLGITLARRSTSAIPELLPGNSLTVTQRISGVPPALWLTARVSIRPTVVDGDATDVASARRSATALAWSWYLLVPIALVLGLGYWLSRRYGPRIRAWWHQSRLADGGPSRQPERVEETASVAAGRGEEIDHSP